MGKLCGFHRFYVICKTFAYICIYQFFTKLNVKVFPMYLVVNFVFTIRSDTHLFYIACIAVVYM